MKKLLYFLFSTIVSVAFAGNRTINPYFKKDKTQKDKWQLVWNEEFKVAKDFDKNWDAENKAPDHIKSSRWRENVEIKKGFLFLNNKKEEKAGKSWTSASVTKKEAVSYGYMECRMKISKSTGLNNAFWLYNWSREHHNAFEIDIVEAHYPNIIRTNIHDNGMKDNKINIQHSQKIDVDLDLSKKFHIYGLEWSEKFIKYYFDGVLVRVEENTCCKASAKLVLGTAVLDWAGPVTDAIDGTSMIVDWVRYYKLKK